MLTLIISMAGMYLVIQFIAELIGFILAIAVLPLVLVFYIIKGIVGAIDKHIARQSELTPQEDNLTESDCDQIQIINIVIKQ